MAMVSPMHKGRLGRGLASLIGEPSPAQSRLPPEGEQRMISIDQIRAGKLNPRKEFPPEELQELADSIQQKGLVQPILVRPERAPGTGYEIVAGERRWRASQKAGLHAIPAIVRELEDQEVLELAIIENVQRADLNPIEEAMGYNELIERYGYTQEALAEVIGKSRSHLANTLRLLKLPDSVRNMVQQGQLSAGHGRALIGREDAELLAHRVLRDDLNVREIESLVQGGPVRSEPKKPREKDPDTRAFEKELADVLGLKVEIKKGSGESGVLMIKYGNYDQLDYIRMRVTGSTGE